MTVQPVAGRWFLNDGIASHGSAIAVFGRKVGGTGQLVAFSLEISMKT